MRPIHFVRAVVLVAAGVLSAVGDVDSRPPRLRHDLPGDSRGKLWGSWIAPYVKDTHCRVGDEWRNEVQWFDEDGSIVREVSSSSAQPGFVSATADGQRRIYGTCQNWEFVLPKKGVRASFMTATSDSRTFLHQFHPEDRKIAVDMYVRGQLVGTIGPFMQYKGVGVKLSPDGSAGLLVWKTKDKKVVQAVSAGRDGKVRLRADCGDGSGMPSIPWHGVAPNGRGVLIEFTARREGNRFSYYTPSRPPVSLALASNPLIAGWLPNSDTCVWRVGPGYQSIDWRTGAIRWSVVEMSQRRVTQHGENMAIVGKYLLLARSEHIRWGPDLTGPARILYAVDVDDGRVVAHWLAWPSSPSLTVRGGRFALVSDRLYFVTADEFSELRLEDIESWKNGWRRGSLDGTWRHRPSGDYLPDRPATGPPAP